jgi:hypothetical protein
MVSFQPECWSTLRHERCSKLERLACNQDGQVMLTLKMPYQDGTTYIVLPPLGSGRRSSLRHPSGDLRSWCEPAGSRFVIAATGRACSPAKAQLFRFHGVFLPNAKLRSEIIPGTTRKTKVMHPMRMTMCSSPGLGAYQLGTFTKTGVQYQH